MKTILYITQHQPHRTSCGSELRAYHIRRALEEVGDVHVVVIQGADEAVPMPPQPGAVHVERTLPVHPVKRRGILSKIRWALDPRIPFPHGRGVDSRSDEFLREHSSQYDLIWFSKLRTANMFSTWSWPHSVVDIDDVPSTYEFSMMANQRELRRRLISAVRYFSWRRRERLLGKRFTVLAVCSETDKRYLERLRVDAPIHVIPNGSVARKGLPVRNPSKPPRIGFVGLLDYFPNREGIQWFIAECWPLIKQQIPDARLRIAGKGSDQDLLVRNQNDIDRLGWVRDLEGEIATWSVMIVPIRVGAGTREKIAYGFGQQCPIVSTPLGAMGYDVSNGEELLIAGSAGEFAFSCVRIIRSEPDVPAMVRKAYQKFLLHWNWDAIAPRIREAAEDCLRLNHKTGVELRKLASW